MDHVFSFRDLLLSFRKQSCTLRKIVLSFFSCHPQEVMQIMLVYKISVMWIWFVSSYFFNSWDNNEREKMSPWDMEPIPEGSKYAFKNEL